MSVAFDFSKDKPLTKEDFKPFKIVSLWDMKRFYATAWFSVCSFLGEIQGAKKALEMVKQMKQKGGRITEPRPPSMDESMASIAPELRRIGLPFSAMSAERVSDFIANKNQKQNPSELPIVTDEFMRRLKDEMKDQLLFILPSTHAKFYEIAGTFLGEDTLAQIPELREDAEEAGNCFAFGRYTACVFHLMRVMERCVQKMGRLLGLSEIFTYESAWQIILNKTRGAIKQRWSNERDPERIKYESVISHLETVKIAWRNPIMHPKQTYTEEQASEVLGAVKTFVCNFVQLRGDMA